MSKIGNLQAKIWGLDPRITSFQNIRTLLSMNYYEPIDYLNDQDIDLKDKTLMHHWDNISSNKTYKVNYKDTTINIEYFTAVGLLEHPTARAKAFADNECTYLLSRERRVNDYHCNAIFLNISGRYYAIVYGSTSSFQAKTILMGNGHKHRKKPEWGKVDDTPVQFSLNNDYFYWKFNKFDQQEVIDSNFGEIEIRDIKGIGRLSERTRCDTKGTGPNYLNEITSKSSLGCNYFIYESDFELVTTKANIITNINQYSDCTIDTLKTVFLSSENAFEPIHGKEVELLLHIYLELIPGLVSAYNNDCTTKNWTTSESSATQKKWAFDAIKELCHFHQITLDEIAATLMS